MHDNESMAWVHMKYTVKEMSCKYIVLRNEEIFQLAIIWMELEDAVLSKVYKQNDLTYLWIIE